MYGTKVIRRWYPKIRRRSHMSSIVLRYRSQPVLVVYKNICNFMCASKSSVSIEEVDCSGEDLSKFREKYLFSLRGVQLRLYPPNLITDWCVEVIEASNRHRDAAPDGIVAPRLKTASLITIKGTIICCA